MKVTVKATGAWKNLPFAEYIVISVVLSLVTIAMTVILTGKLPPVVPLFYGRPVGEGQLVPTLSLLLAPGAAIILTIINTFLAILSKDDFLKKILVLTSFLVSLLLCITVAKIILLVGFFK